MQAARWSSPSRRSAGILHGAGGVGEHAARMEAAALRQVERRRHGAFDRQQAVAVLLDLRDAAEQAERVGMLRIVEDRGTRRALHHAAGVHHRDLVGHLGDDAEVVGDQDDRHAGLLLQFAQQVEDLRLHRDVERGGGFVGDQQVGLAGQRHGDHHALAHAAGHLVRVFVEAAFRRGDAHALQRRDGAAAQRAGRGGAVVRAHRLGDLVADGEHRVQAGHRLLEDHRDAVAADVAHLRRRQVEQVPAVEHDLPGGDAAGRRHQPHDGQRQHRLAAAALADDAERAAAIDRDVDAVHRGDVAAGGAEHGAQAGDGQQCCLRPCGGGLGRGASRPPPTPSREGGECCAAAHAVRNVSGEICSAVRWSQSRFGTLAFTRFCASCSAAAAAG